MANIGHGTTLAGATVGEIGKLTNISGPNESVDDIDITDMSTTNARREFMAGLIDSGEVSADLIYDKTLYNTVQGALGNAAEVWTITLSDGTTIAASGYLKANGLAVPMEDKITQAITIKLSGEITVTPASG